MSRLDPLIRLQKHRIDEKQRFIAGLYREMETLQADKDRQIAQMEQERKAMEDMQTMEAAALYGRYAEGMRLRIRAIDNAIARIEERVNRARDDLQRSFAELKKIEIVQRNRAEEAQKAEAKKESDALDEIALEGFRRQNED